VECVVAKPTTGARWALIACTLGARDLARQAERWKSLLAEAGSRRVVTERGLRVYFRGSESVERELRELVAVEVECCAWAEWTVEPHEGELLLEIHSTGDGIPVIQSCLLAEEADI
jgi:hypothetical protein